MRLCNPGLCVGGGEELMPSPFFPVTTLTKFQSSPPTMQKNCLGALGYFSLIELAKTTLTKKYDILALLGDRGEPKWDWKNCCGSFA